MMKSFLEHVADDIMAKYGTDLSQITVVFPNKRASLFLNDYLAHRAGRPVWSPRYTTISELFCQHSSLRLADPIKLVCDLYRVFARLTGIDETLDHFYGWGQVLITDFDDIDKHMADADKVFANLRDIHEFDGIDYLSDEQKAALRKFFSTFSDDQHSIIRERFLRLWSHIGDIYHAFNQRLAEQGLAYEGALYRHVVEQLAAGGDDFPADRAESSLLDDRQTYLFVGFNMVQEVEKRLFSWLKGQGRARFYWDFDRYYMQGNEAGHFIGQYLSLFPSELDIEDDAIFSQFSQPKQLCFVSATTENVQARYVSQWLDNRQRLQAGRRTAIVLCNEALLPAVVSSLPGGVDKVNITTGFPLAQSPVASLVRLLIAQQTQGWVAHRGQYRLHFVKRVLHHPYAVFISPQAQQLAAGLQQARNYYPTVGELSVDEGTSLLFATPVTDNATLLAWLCSVVQTVARGGDGSDQLFQESLFRTYTLLNRLRSLTESGDLTVDAITLQRLVAQLIATTSIPFHGEPAEGLQVMGVLETRNLDFDHVLMLSTGEGNMPKGVNDSSFIPYNIRRAYGLTTADHKVSIYAYYFHRLLQRASDVTIVYNHATSDGQTGEMSRFMLQLMVESPHPVSFFALQAGQQLQPSALQPVEKSDEVIRRLLRRFSLSEQDDPGERRPLLTPTSINRYLRCQLQFYYRYVCNLAEPDVTDDDSIDNRVFGNIFHEAARIVYSVLGSRGRIVTAGAIAQLLKERHTIERAVDEAFASELFTGSSHRALSGLQIISREVIIHYLVLLLRQDQKMAPFTIVGLECDVLEPITVSCGQHRFQSLIGGRIDRLDQVVQEVGGSPREHLRVIDYKTGSRRPDPFPTIDDVFTESSQSRHSDYYLQTMLYACQVRRSADYNPQRLPVSPALLYIQHAADNPVLSLGTGRIDDVGAYEQPFARHLGEVVAQIFDPARPFVPTSERSRCQDCPYKAICDV